MAHRLKRCHYCGQRHALRDDAVVRWCDGVLEHRARWLLGDASQHVIREAGFAISEGAFVVSLALEAVAA